MPHIHTEPGQHDHTVTAYIVRTDMDQPRVLMHMHKKLHKLMPVGGHIELDETPWQAISHELREEAGYDIDDLAVLQPKERIKLLGRVVLHPYPVVIDTHDIPEAPGGHFHTDTAYAFTADHPPQYERAKGESDDLRWLTCDELVELTDDQTFQNNKQVGRYVLTTCLTAWEEVAVDTFVK